MLTLTKRKKDTAAEGAETSAEGSPEGDKPNKKTPTVGHPWTAGERFKTMGVSAVLWACVASGPIAVWMHMGDDPVTPGPVAEAGQDVADSQSASAYAAMFMDRYLSTPRGEEDTVSAMLARGVTDRLSLPAKQPSIVAITPAEAVQLDEMQWIVTVAVQTAGDEESPDSITYWQVPVLAQDDSLAVAGLPSVVAAPATGDLSVSAGDDLNDNAVTSTVSTFMDAYLAGRGEVAPITSPDSALGPVSPAPFSEVSVTSVRATEPLPESPADGDMARVQISATATADGGSKRQLGYELELRYRDRWEVHAVNPTPLEGEQS